MRPMSRGLPPFPIDGSQSAGAPKYQWLTDDSWQEAIVQLQQKWSQSTVENIAILHHRADFDGPNIQHFPAGQPHLVEIDLQKLLNFLAQFQSEAVLICHSHIGQCAMPSRNDIVMTRKLVQICELLRIDVIDHLILSGKYCFSFRDQGLL